MSRDEMNRVESAFLFPRTNRGSTVLHRISDANEMIGPIC